MSFRDPSFAIISIISAITVCLAYRHINKFKNTIVFFDAIGLGAFTATGASLAVEHSLNTLFAVVVLSLTTGIGGGVLRDIFAKEVPFVFHKEVYAVASILGAVGFFYVQTVLNNYWALYFCFALTVGLRLVCIKYDIHLPHVEVKNKFDRKAA